VQGQDEGVSLQIYRSQRSKSNRFPFNELYRERGLLATSPLMENVSIASCRPVLGLTLRRTPKTPDSPPLRIRVTQGKFH